MGRLIAPNGGIVHVSDAKAERLLAHGYKAAGGGAAAVPGPDGTDAYKGQTKAQLLAELDRRNDAREDDDQLAVTGKVTVGSLKAVLAADDELNDPAAVAPSDPSDPGNPDPSGDPDGSGD